MSIKVTIDNEDFEIPIPNGMTLRKQHPECNKKNSVCAKMDDNLVCVKLTLKSYPDGSYEFFEINPCSKSKNKIVMEL